MSDRRALQCCLPTHPSGPTPTSGLRPEQNCVIACTDVAPSLFFGEAALLALVSPGLMARSIDNRFLAEQYRLHANLVFGRCLVMGGGDRAFAEDVTHDVFIRLMEHADDLDRSTSLAPWLVTVAYRLCANRLRHERGVWQRVRTALLAQPPAPPWDPAAADPDPLEGDPEALAAALGRSLAELPPKERAVVTMRYLDGLSQVQIARTLGHSEGYISKLLGRALAKLRVLHWKVDDE